MMEAKELRVLNFVNYQEGTTKKQGFICCINYTTVTVGDFTERYTVKLKNLEPIPLTEDWLLKFGFVKNVNAKNCWFISGVIAIQKDVYNDGFSLANDEYHPELKYVHQIQNLYFALIGEELTMNDLK